MIIRTTPPARSTWHQVPPGEIHYGTFTDVYGFEMRPALPSTARSATLAETWDPLAETWDSEGLETVTTEDDLRTSPRNAPRRPAGSPCRACPYRQDVPSGVWEASEYAKLPAYDRPTQEQPMAVFLCHEQNGRVCAGWAGCHDTDELFALRFAAREMDPADLEATRDYASPVPLFASGAEAARHGLADVDNPRERGPQGSQPAGDEARPADVPVREDDGVKLGIQAWAGDAEPSPGRFDPVTGPGQLYKPSAGGLWTSTWAEQTGSGWIDWCLDAEFRGPVFDVWLLTPVPTVRIYEIDSLPDLQRLVDLYPSQYTRLYDSPCVDWAEVATEWDAVHLTDEGQWRTRMTHPISLYGWDCESTLWFRWCFTEVSHYGEWKAAA